MGGFKSYFVLHPRHRKLSWGIPFWHNYFNQIVKRPMDAKNNCIEGLVYPLRQKKTSIIKGCQASILSILCTVQSHQEFTGHIMRRWIVAWEILRSKRLAKEIVQCIPVASHWYPIGNPILARMKLFVSVQIHIFWQPGSSTISTKTAVFLCRTIMSARRCVFWLAESHPCFCHRTDVFHRTTSLTNRN